MDSIIKLIQLRCISWNLHYSLTKIIAQTPNIDKHLRAAAVKALEESQAAYDADPWGN